MPVAPPTTPTLPNVPLWLLSGRRGKTATSAAVEDHAARLEQGAHVQPEVAHVQFAAVVRAIECEQSRLERDEGYRMLRADGTPQHAAAVGVQPAGDIQCKHLCAAGIDRIDQIRVTARQLALEPDPKQTVYDQAETLLASVVGERLAA
jgi:hypothetical protein